MTPASDRPAIDVSALPDVASGHRDPLFWGVAGLIAIESTMLALLAGTYFYVRGNFQAWPPVEFGQRAQLIAAAEALVLAVSAVPVHLMNAAALRADVRATRRWLLVATLASGAFVALRGVQFTAIPFHWDRDAYASTVWGFLFLNALHGISGFVESAVMAALAVTGPFERKHFGDVYAGGLLWYFVVASWLPLYVVLYLAPGLLRT
jgi:heme/copper-type cytochrome/quinol oxidase subunit 3